MENVTDYHGADRISARGKCHGLSRSGYPPSKNSRIFAERISVKQIFHGADYLTPSNTPHRPWDLSTVHRSNNPFNINGYLRIVDGYPRTSRRRVRNTFVCGSWIDAHGRRGCVCMCVLLWALTVRLMFSCFHHVLRQNFGFHNGVIGELLIQNSISRCYPANRSTFIR